MPPKLFYLNISGTSVRNVADLRAHFVRAEVLKLYRNGTLRRWLSFFPEGTDLAAALDALDPGLAEDNLWAALCATFEAEEAAPAAVPEPAPAPAPMAKSSGDEPPRITAALRIAQLAESVAGYRALLEKMADDIGDWKALAEDAYRLERDYLPLFVMTSPKVFEIFKNTKALLAIVQCEGLWAVWRDMPEIEHCFSNSKDNVLTLLGLTSSQKEYETTIVHESFGDENDRRWERVQKHISSPDSFVDVGEIFTLWDDGYKTAMRSADEPDTVYEGPGCRFVRLREPEFSAICPWYYTKERTLVYIPVVDGELQFRDVEATRHSDFIVTDVKSGWQAETKAKLEALSLPAAAESSADGRPNITAALRRELLAQDVNGYQTLLEKMVDDIDDWKALLADAERLEQEYLPLFTITLPAVFEAFQRTRALLAIVQREGLGAVWRRCEPEINSPLFGGSRVYLFGLASSDSYQKEYETVTVRRHFRPLDSVFNVAPVWKRVQKRVYSPSAMVDVGEIFVLGFFKLWDHGDDYRGIAMRSADEPDTVYEGQDCRFIRLRRPEFSATGEDDAVELVYFPVVDGELQFNDTEKTYRYWNDESWKNDTKTKLAILFL